MRLYLGLVLLIICSVGGYLFSIKYTERRKFFTSFSSFNFNLINEVAFFNGTIIDILKKEYNNDDFYFALNEIFVNKRNYLIEKKYLLKEHKIFFNDYVSNVGKSDSKTQLRFLEGAKVIIDKYLNECILDEKKIKPICVKIGVLIGLALMVLVL